MLSFIHHIIAIIQHIFYFLKETFYSNEKQYARQLLVDAYSRNNYDVGDIIVKYHYQHQDELPGDPTEDKISYFKITQKNRNLTTATKIHIIPLSPSSSYGFVEKIIEESSYEFPSNKYKWMIPRQIKKGDLLAIREF